MKVLFAVAVLAVAAQCVLAAPSGLVPLGGVVLSGPTTISHSSLVQTHPSPAVVVHQPVVAPLVQRTVLVGHAGPVVVPVHGHGLYW